MFNYEQTRRVKLATSNYQFETNRNKTKFFIIVLVLQILSVLRVSSAFQFRSNSVHSQQTTLVLQQKKISFGYVKFFSTSKQHEDINNESCQQQLSSLLSIQESIDNINEDTTLSAIKQHDQLQSINQKQIQTEVDSAYNYKIVLYDLTRAGLLGLITGSSVAAFKLLIEILRLESYSLPFLVEPLIAALVPAIGGLAVGLLALFGPFPPGLKGIVKETDRDTRALFADDEANSTFNPLPFLRKTLAAICTLGTGCSLGPEGPSVELGVNLSRCITSSSQIPDTTVAETLKHNRLLLSCGASAGVAAGFNAPIAGIFFALEVIQGQFSNTNTGTGGRVNGSSGSIAEETINNDNLISTKGGISSIVLCAVIAALVSKTILGDELVFKVTQYSLDTPLLELPLYLLLGSLSGVLAFSFNQLSITSRKLFSGEIGPEPIRDLMTTIPFTFKPIIGGLFCGLVGIYYPQILFFGYETLNSLLAKTSLSLELLLSLLAVKMITTAVASGSGLVGGLFAPSLFFGGMLGASFHKVLEYSFQGIGGGIAEVPAYAMIGSASVLAAFFRAPLTASLLLFECTREYEIILPLMASAGLASIVADALDLWSTGAFQENTVKQQATVVPATEVLISVTNEQPNGEST